MSGTKGVTGTASDSLAKAGGGAVSAFSAAPVGSGVAKCAAPECQVKHKSGGLSSLTLDVTFEVANCKCDSLQVIQVAWASPIAGKATRGTAMKAFGETYWAFVDGGKKSPYVTESGNAPAHATKPYYLTSSEVASQVSFSGGNGTVEIYDQPTAATSHDKLFFETAIVCVNYNKSGKDKVLKAFKWGWVKKGTQYQSNPSGTGAISSAGLEMRNNVSAEFLDVLKNDYPGYTLY